MRNSASSAGQCRFVAEDFFASVIEPLLVSAARDGFKIILVHEDSQDHPFWWDRYPSREHRVHLQKDPFKPSLREISTAHRERMAILDLSHNPISVTPVSPAKTPEEDEGDLDE